MSLDSSNSFEADFFKLLQVGLGKPASTPLSDNFDWVNIFKLASEQSVLGIIADGLNQIRSTFPNVVVPNECRKCFLTNVVEIDSRNTEIACVQSEICEMLHQNNIEHFVVKGLSAAQFYPNPSLRTQGDIDILVGRSDYDSAISVLSSKATRMDTEDKYLVHQGLWFGKNEVEIHGALHPKLGEKIDRILDVNQTELFNGSISFETFCTEYLFIHCLQHFHWTGLGIRQIIDWACWIKANYNIIDWKRVSSDIIRMRLTKEWSIFESFVSHYLSISFGKTISKREKVTDEDYLLWESCKERGNMGRNTSPKVSKNFVKRNALAVLNILVQFNKMRKFSPQIRYNLMFVRFSVLLQQLGK